MITNTGYRRRTFEEILEAKITKAREIFGEDISTDETTALGKFIRINAYDQHHTEEIAESIYYSIFPDTAAGQSLDRIGWIAGISRNLPSPARHLVKIVGETGTTIGFDFKVCTDEGVEFYNTTETTIESGECTITVECTESGTIGNVAPADINRAVNSSASIDTVLGLELVQAGEDEESDYEYRKRFEVAREGRGSCSATSIVSALASIPSVRNAYVTVNEDATQTVDNIPPKTIACYVNGGRGHEQEIAEAIFDKKPIGVGTYGAESVLVSYGALLDYPVRFSFAEAVELYIQVDITTSADFTESGNADIKEAIASFVNDIEIGAPLVTTTLYRPIYGVAGVVSALVKVSTDGVSYGTDNIEINPYESYSLMQVKINGAVV